MGEWREVNRSKALLHLIRTEKPKTVLDVGCGNGELLANLIKRGYLKKENCYGLDNNAKKIQGITEFNAFCYNANDLASLHWFKNYFDLIICTQVIEHIQNDGLLLKRIASALKPHGCLFLSTVLKKHNAHWVHNGKLDSTHVREYEKESELLPKFEQAGLKVVWRGTKRTVFKHVIPVIGYRVWEIIAIKEAN